MCLLTNSLVVAYEIFGVGSPQDLASPGSHPVRAGLELPLGNFSGCWGFGFAESASLFACYVPYLLSSGSKQFFLVLLLYRFYSITSTPSYNPFFLSPVLLCRYPRHHNPSPRDLTAEIPFTSQHCAAPPSRILHLPPQSDNLHESRASQRFAMTAGLNGP